MNLFQREQPKTFTITRVIYVRSYTVIQWPPLDVTGLTSPTLVGVAPPQYFPDRLNMERDDMAINSGSLLFNHDIPLAALPAPVLGQEWRNPLQSVGPVPLDPTPVVLNANPYMGSDDIQLTQVSCVPGPVNNSLTWTRLLGPSPHLDHSIDYVSLLFVFCSHALAMKYMSFLSSNLH